MIDINDPDSIPHVLTPKEFGQIHRLTANAVRQMCKRGELGHYKIGKRTIRIPRAAHDEYLLKCNPQARRAAAELQYAEHMETRRQKRKAR
jgi:excisionase family DNA binding protein